MISCNFLFSGCLRRPPFFPGPKKVGKERPESPAPALLFVFSPGRAINSKTQTNGPGEKTGENTHEPVIGADLHTRPFYYQGSLQLTPEIALLVFICFVIGFSYNINLSGCLSPTVLFSSEICLVNLIFFHRF